MKNQIILIGISFLFLSVFIECNQPPFTKLSSNKVISGKDARKGFEAYLVPANAAAAITNPLIIKIVAGINDSSYYTRQSVDECRQKLDLLRILGNDLAVLASCDIQNAKSI